MHKLSHVLPLSCNLHSNLFFDLLKYKFRTIEILEEEAEIVKEKYSGNDNVEY